MRISTGFILCTALFLGPLACGGCDDKDSGKQNQKSEAAATTRANDSMTPGLGWVPARDQRLSVWRFAARPAPLAGSQLVGTGALPAALPAAPATDTEADDPLAGIRAALGANMLPARDSVPVTGLVNRALQAAALPATEALPTQPLAVLITTPWNDDTVLLWIALPRPLMTDATTVSVEFDPKTVGTFRALGDPSALPAPNIIAAGYARAAMLYELSLVSDNVQPKAGAAGPALRYGVVRVTGAGADQRRIDRPITAADAVGGIDNAPDAAQFVAAVAGFGGLLRGDPTLRDLSCNDAIVLAEAASQPDPDGWHARVIALMRQAEPLIDLPTRETVLPTPEDPPK
jgi:hypothetical protein